MRLNEHYTGIIEDRIRGVLDTSTKIQHDQGKEFDGAVRKLM